MDEISMLMDVRCVAWVASKPQCVEKHGSPLYEAHDLKDGLSQLDRQFGRRDEQSMPKLLITLIYEQYLQARY